MENITLPSIRQQQELLDKIKYLEIQLEEYEERRSWGQGEVVRLTNKNKMLEEENEKLKKENEKLQAQAYGAGDKELLGLLGGMKIAGDGQETEVEALKKEVSEKEHARAYWESEVNRLSGRVNEVNSDLSVATGTINEQEKQIAAYQDEAHRQEQVVQELRGECRRLGWVLGAKDQEVMKLKMKNALLHEELKNVEEDAVVVPVVVLETVNLAAVEVAPYTVVPALVSVDLGASHIAPVEDVVQLVAVNLGASEVVPHEEERVEEQEEEEPVVPVVHIPKKRKREDEEESAGRSRKRVRYNDE